MRASIRAGLAVPIAAGLAVAVLAFEPRLLPSAPVSVDVVRAPSPPPAPASDGNGLWVSREQLLGRPTSGAAWASLAAAAAAGCGVPHLADQDDGTNVCVMAQALVFARTGNADHRLRVASALRTIANSGAYSGRALALGRELVAYVIAADLIDLRSHDAALDASFRVKIRSLLTARTTGGPASLIECHEKRPNNWGTHCGASRAAVAAYLGDTAELAQVARVFKGWLGDRASYAGFSYGELDWQCDASAPVGINPPGCRKDGHDIDGVLADDQRRGGGFTWPPFRENYVWEAMQGAMAQATILQQAGYDVFGWQDRALLRAARWLHDVDGYPCENDDTWQPHLINFYYGTSFPAPVPSRPGKNVGWTDWTHGR